MMTVQSASNDRPWVNPNPTLPMMLHNGASKKEKEEKKKINGKSEKGA
jgi:hypothetical protein